MAVVLGRKGGGTGGGAPSGPAGGVLSGTYPNPGLNIELDYVERTTNLTVTATTASGADTFITGTSQAYAAVPIKIEVWASLVDLRQFIQLQLWDGATDLGCIGSVSSANAANVGAPGYGVRYLTPTAATHQYIIKAWRGITNGTIYAGSGGTAGEHLPAFLRVTVA